MLEPAISAAKWVIDTLLKKRGEDKTSKRQKWIQVADYLESIAELLDNAILDYYDKKELPHGLYAQLVEMQYDFMSVLKQVYGKDKDSDTIERYRRALSRALHLMTEGDTAIPPIEHAFDPRHIEGATKASGMTEAGTRKERDRYAEYSQRIRGDLQTVAGQFRAGAATLRAVA